MPAKASRKNSLDALDHPSISSEEYKQKLKEYSLRLLTNQLRLAETRHNVVIMFEGVDAAGKGGAIKRLVERLDPRLIRVYSVGKPTPQELSHHYMRRFWLRLPPYGQIAIYDRSWYGRVLVERVEGFATQSEWKRAYDEINSFEKMLVDDHTILIKFYLHITKDEQLLRFRRREADPYKHWKITDEDWRNRNHWDENNIAAQDAFAKTDTKWAPWTIIPANYKWYTRLRVLKIVTERVEKALSQ